MRSSLLLMFLRLFFIYSVLYLINTEVLIAQDNSENSRVDSLISKAKSLIEEDNKLSKALLDEASILSEKIKYWEGTALTLKNYGVLQDISGNTEGAQDYYDQALSIYRKHNVTDDRVTDIELNKGVAFYLSGQNDLALQQYLIAYRGYSKSGNQKRISSVLNNLGIIYRIKKDYKKARKAYSESYNLKLILGDSLGGAKNLNNIALLYSYEELIDSSIHYFAESKRLFKRNGYDGNAQLVDLDLGYAYYLANEYEKAIELLSRSLNSDIVEYANAKQRVGAAIALSGSLREVGKEYEAYRILQDNRLYIEEHGTLSDRSDFYHSISQIYQNQKNYRLAYENLEKHRTINSELLSLNRLKYEEEMTAQFDLLGKENELQAQELTLVSHRKTRDRLIAGVGFISILSALLYLLLRTKNKLNTDLEQKNGLLNKALNDKSVLLKEIHHRVKNNLQIISSLLNLQRRHQNNEKTSAAFLDGQSRVKSMSMIHQLLYQEDQLTSINTRLYVDKLVNSLSASYKVNLDNISIQNEVAEILLDVDTMIPIGLILNELVTNAFKYAFNNDVPGTLGISLSEIDEKLELRVYDDGKGFPDNFDTQNSNSFGFKLVHSLCRKLEADVSIQEGEYNTVLVSMSTYKIITQ